MTTGTSKSVKTGIRIGFVVAQQWPSVMQAAYLLEKRRQTDSKPARHGGAHKLFLTHTIARRTPINTEGMGGDTIVMMWTLILIDCWAITRRLFTYLRYAAPKRRSTVNVEMERAWKNRERPVLRYCATIYLGKSGIPRKTSRQNCRSQGPAFWSSKWPLTKRFPHQNSTCISWNSHRIYVFNLTQPPLFRRTIAFNFYFLFGLLNGSYQNVSSSKFYLHFLNFSSYLRIQSNTTPCISQYCRYLATCTVLIEIITNGT
jgi:hypothetical protein